MPGFRDRLRKAIQSGEQEREQRKDDEREARQRALRREALYDRYEYALCDHIQSCLEDLCEEWPGFKLTPATGEKGRGFAIDRDDRVRSTGGGRDRRYSRLELTVRSHTKGHFLEVLAKGTIRNKEVIRRSEDDRVETLDPGLMKKFIERVVMEYARAYAEGGTPGRR
jgi:hypothetical protein